MKCEEYQNKCKHGILSSEEEQQFEQHTLECESCQLFLHRLVEQELSSSSFPPVQEKKLELQPSFRKAKWKQRLNITSFVIIALVGILVLGNGLSYFYYYTSDRGMKLSNIQQLALESMIPNVRVSQSALNIQPFFRMENKMQLEKTVGKEEIPIGEFTSHLLFNRSGKLELDWSSGVFEDKLYFIHPQAFDKTQHESWTNEVWNALEKLPEGTVSEVAVSFDQPYTLNEINDLFYHTFLNRDLIPVWYALDTGEEKQLDSPYISSFTVIGFRRNVDIWSGEPGFQGTDDEKVVRMLSLLQENEGLINRLRLGQREVKWEERLNYVKNNGVKVYGAVITGPTKELLRLREVPQVTYATLGEVKLWNWFDRPSQSRFY